MFEQKESIWRKKGFYLSVCTAIVCLMVVGAVYYKMNYQEDSGQRQSKKLAQNNEKKVNEKNAVATPEARKKQEIAKDKTVAASQTQNASKKSPGRINKSKQQVQRNAAKESAKPTGTEIPKASANKKSASAVDSHAIVFHEAKGLRWPIQGKVIMKYSMNNTTYFKTLAQYKCNPAIEIAAVPGKKVVASASGTVLSVQKKDETGVTVSTNIGGGYVVKYGQLANVSVKKGQRIAEGQSIGTIAKTTKYFAEEGNNLYMQVLQNGKTVDPMLLLR